MFTATRPGNTYEARIGGPGADMLTVELPREQTRREIAAAMNGGRA